MGANQQYTRVDTLELKALLYQKIGQQRADKYFNLLNKLFSLQLTKNNFDKFCIRTIGRENLPLHNRLISSIVKNAALSKTPPPTIKKLTNSLNVKVPRASQKTSLQSLYGESFPLSHRKSRSPRDRRFKDRPSPLGPNGKSDYVGEKVQPELHQSPTELYSLGSRPPVEVLSVEDGEEVVSGSPGIQSRSPVTAPLGISLKMNKARKSLYHPYSIYGSQPQTCQNSYELPASSYLRTRLKHKLEGEGLSIPEDCANLLNAGLDAYLKRLIEPCVDLARSKIGQTSSSFNGTTSGFNGNLYQTSGFNGTLYQKAPGFNGTLHQKTSGFNGTLHQQRPRMMPGVSLLDLSVSMESDPRRLGCDWSTQVERLRFSNLAE